jgi:ArpU family phage transcriptional regulator
VNRQIRKKVEKMLREYPDIDIRIASMEMELESLCLSVTAHYGFESSGYKELNKVESLANQRVTLMNEIRRLRRIKMVIDSMLPKLDARERKIFNLRYINDKSDTYVWMSIPMSKSGYFYAKEKLLMRFAYCLGIENIAA